MTRKTVEPCISVLTASSKAATISAFSTMIAAGNGLAYIRNETYYSRYDFFTATHVIGCLVSLATSIVHALSMQDTLGTNQIWNHLVFVTFSLFV